MDEGRIDTVINRVDRRLEEGRPFIVRRAPDKQRVRPGKPNATPLPLPPWHTFRSPRPDARSIA